MIFLEITRIITKRAVLEVLFIFWKSSNQTRKGILTDIIFVRVMYKIKNRTLICFGHVKQMNEEMSKFDTKVVTIQ